MFRKLHLQLTFFCTLITGLILVTMTCICLYISESGMLERDYNSFLDNLNTIFTYFESQTTISHQWILQVQANYHVKLQILDNETPLFSQQLDSDESLDALYNQAYETARSDYGFDKEKFNASNVLTKHVEFKMEDPKGGQYYASLALIPRDNGYLRVTTLYSQDILKQDILFQRSLFGLVNIAAIILLAVFSWHFTKRMLKPIQESRERQVQFIAAASHELRSPLTVILTSLSAMKIASREQSEHFSETIQSEGHRMSRLIDDMLTLANADNRTWSIHPEHIDLDTLLLQTFENYEQVVKEKGQTLLIELPDEVSPDCQCDRERMAQVLSILLDNASCYTPKGGIIKLGLVLESSKAKIYVSDNGPGVPDEAKKSIFERFYRADQSHKDKAHFGLGLCIAKEIMKLHKGKIVVEDSPEGGAAFILTLPLAP